VLGVIISPDAEYLYTCAYDGDVVKWQIDSREIVWHRPFDGATQALALTDDRLFVALDTSSTLVLDASSGETVGEADSAHDGEVIGLAAHQGMLLLSVSCWASCVGVSFVLDN
jgi:WD40 repeat protein